MNKALGMVVNNATKTALNIDGYNQSIIKEHDDSYSFTRSCDGCCPEWYGTIIGEVVTYWENGILKARYEGQGRESS